MTPEQRQNLDNWLTLLRSGIYTQGQSRLRIGETHCCLGVACEALNIPHDDNGYRCGTEFHLHSLADNFTKLFGLPDRVQQRCISMNDSVNPASFEQIADYVESQLPEATP